MLLRILTTYRYSEPPGYKPSEVQNLVKSPQRLLVQTTGTRTSLNSREVLYYSKLGLQLMSTHIDPGRSTREASQVLATAAPLCVDHQRRHHCTARPSPYSTFRTSHSNCVTVRRPHRPQGAVCKAWAAQSMSL